MVKQITLLLSIALFIGLASSCNKGVGCPSQENLKTQMNKKGEYKVKQTKSGLWSKKARKKQG